MSTGGSRTKENKQSVSFLNNKRADKAEDKELTSEYLRTMELAGSQNIQKTTGKSGISKSELHLQKFPYNHRVFQRSQKNFNKQKDTYISTLSVQNNFYKDTITYWSM